VAFTAENQEDEAQARDPPARDCDGKPLVSRYEMQGAWDDRFHLFHPSTRDGRPNRFVSRCEPSRPFVGQHRSAAITARHRTLSVVDERQGLASLAPHQVTQGARRGEQHCAQHTEHRDTGSRFL
jgi:hypothetical protein